MEKFHSRWAFTEIKRPKKKKKKKKDYKLQLTMQANWMDLGKCAKWYLNIWESLQAFCVYFYLFSKINIISEDKKTISPPVTARRMLQKWFFSWFLQVINAILSSPEVSWSVCVWEEQVYPAISIELSSDTSAAAINHPEEAMQSSFNWQLSCTTTIGWTAACIVSYFRGGKKQCLGIFVS